MLTLDLMIVRKNTDAHHLMQSDRSRHSTTSQGSPLTDQCRDHNRTASASSPGPSPSTSTTSIGSPFSCWISKHWLTATTHPSCEIDHCTSKLLSSQSPSRPFALTWTAKSTHAKKMLAGNHGNAHVRAARKRCAVERIASLVN